MKGGILNKWYLSFLASAISYQLLGLVRGIGSCQHN